ncbi:MAG TPA: sulfite exporter TauE/SafE family protein [Candidatus Eisenbacteria bacterium]|nr:sulfite exporter TauE/SafE family protein [Candidatus Eisenbacteria bacterium]
MIPPEAWLAAIAPAVAIGFVGGTLVGVTGVGAGSVIAALLLVCYPDISPQVIVGSATTQAVMMKLAGVWVRRQFQLGERSLGVAMALGAIPCAVAGAWTSSRLEAGMLRPIITGVLVVVGILLVLQAFRRGTMSAAAREAEAAAAVPRTDMAKGDPAWGGVFGIGSVVGYVAGLTSIGTGTLFVSALAGPLRVDAHRAVAAALMAGLLTLIVSAGTHVMLGHLDPALAVITTVGSVPGVIAGTKLGRRLTATWLRGAIGVGILIAAGLSLARLR